MPQFTLEHFIDFNSNISSEMFVSVMTILHERLPCAQFYFRQYKQFKKNNKEMSTGFADGQNEDKKSQNSIGNYSSPDQRAEKKSYITAIASPNLIKGYSPTIAKGG